MGCNMWRCDDSPKREAPTQDERDSAFIQELLYPGTNANKWSKGLTEQPPPPPLDWAELYKRASLFCEKPTSETAERFCNGFGYVKRVQEMDEWNAKQRAMRDSAVKKEKPSTESWLPPLEIQR